MMSTSDMEINPQGLAAFLMRAGLDRRIVELEPEQNFFTQGDPADEVFFLEKGRVKLTVVSKMGKQATIALLSPGGFFGEESLATAAAVRSATAIAVNTCTALKIKREEMIRVLHQEHDFCDEFLSMVLARNVRAQADLVNQLFNSSEKRLARTLLLMAEFGKPEEQRTCIPPVTQETLAEIVGTTRSRISFFMNRFRSLGLIDYKDRIRVHKPRLKAALLDQFAEI
jgi:CRP-like cAMP-binding protein